MDTVETLAAGVESYFDNLGTSSGLGGDQIKYLVCLLAAIPLGLIFSKLPMHKGLRQLFGMFWGLVFCFFCLGRYAWIHSFFTALVAWMLMRFVSPRYSANLVFIWLMAYMSGAHLYRIYTDYLGWHLDFTGPQMLLTQSITSMAFQLHDGWRLKKGQQLEEKYLEQKSLQKLPNLFEFFSFVYFFPAFLAGPSHQFADFQAVCDGSLFPHKMMPSNLSSTILALFRALLFAPAFYLINLIPLEHILDPSFLEMSLFKRWLYIEGAFMVFRSKYYFAWFLSEASFVASGAGWNAVSGKFDRVRNVNVLKVEFAENIRGITSNWNICTANWLKYYVYWRLPKGHIRTYGTYFVSAFWHGFYPGYYTFFIYAALLTETARLCRRVLRPYFVTVSADKKETYSKFKIIYDIVGILATSTFTNFGGFGFVLLSMERTWAALRVQSFYGYILVPLLFIYLSFIHPMIFRKKKVKQ